MDYYLVSRKFPVEIDHAVFFGTIFGALVYGFMHAVVLPYASLWSTGF